MNVQQSTKPEQVTQGSTIMYQLNGTWYRLYVEGEIWYNVIVQVIPVSSTDCTSVRTPVRKVWNVIVQLVDAHNQFEWKCSISSINDSEVEQRIEFPNFSANNSHTAIDLALDQVSQWFAQ